MSCVGSDSASAAQCLVGRAGARLATNWGSALPSPVPPLRSRRANSRRFDPETVAIIMLGTMIEAAMLIVVADDRSAAREKSDAVIVDLLEGLRR